jgi:hypothetical protein
VTIEYNSLLTIYKLIICKWADNISYFECSAENVWRAWLDTPKGAMES